MAVAVELGYNPVPVFPSIITVSGRSDKYWQLCGGLSIKGCGREFGKHCLKKWEANCERTFEDGTLKENKLKFPYINTRIYFLVSIGQTAFYRRFQ